MDAFNQPLAAHGTPCRDIDGTTPQRSPSPGRGPWPAGGDAEAPTRACRAAVRRRGLQPRQDLSALAARIGVREGELLAAHDEGCTHQTPSPLRAHRLDLPPRTALDALAGPGWKRLRVGNALASLRVDCAPRQSLPLDPAAFDDAAWAGTWAVVERFAHGTLRRSLRVVDADEVGVLAVTLPAPIGPAVFTSLVERFTWRSQPAWGTRLLRAPPDTSGHRAMDGARMRSPWSALRAREAGDTLVRGSGATRPAVLQALGPGYADRLPVALVQDALARAAQVGLTLTVSVCSSGAGLCQDFPVRQVELTRAGVVARAADQRLCIDEDAVAEAWCLRLPTRAGLVHALELFDRRGVVALRLHASHPAGHPEPCAWRELIGSLLADALP